MNTELRLTLLGEVVVPQIEPNCELQFDRQKAATPANPTDQRFPPLGANVIELSPSEVATWFTGI
jgi:hypothetical protein